MTESPSPPAVPRALRLAFAAALLALASVAVWLPAWGGPFLNWDDDWLVESNPENASLSPAYLRRAFDPSIDRRWFGAEYLPLRDLSYALDRTIWGLRPSGYRTTQFALYAATVLALALWVRTLGFSRGASGLAALLFAWHPVHSESLPWIAGRKDVLCGFFLFGGLLLHRASFQGSRRRALLLGSLASLAGPAALLSKGMGIVYPAAIVAGDLFFPLDPRGRPIPLRRTLAVAFASAALAGPLFAIQIEEGREFIIKEYDAPRSTVLSSMAFVLLSYVRRLFVPIALSPLADAGFRELAHPGAILGMAAAGGGLVLLAAALLHRNRLLPVPRALAFAGLWFAISIAPFSNLIPFQHLLADRYLYLAAAGAAIALAAVLTAVPRFAPFLVLPVLASFGALSIERALAWSHPDRLYRDALVRDPRNHFLHLLRGEYLAGLRHPGAERELRLALECPPRSTPFDLSHAEIALANLFASRGDWALAEPGYERAVAIDPGSPQAWAGLGNCRKATLRIEEAIGPLLEACRLAQDEATYPVALAGCYYELGRFGEAGAAFERALEIAPRLFQAHAGLAEIHRRGGNLEAALRHVDAALESAPEGLSEAERDRLLELRRGLLPPGGARLESTRSPGFYASQTER